MQDTGRKVGRFWAGGKKMMGAGAGGALPQIKRHRGKKEREGIKSRCLKIEDTEGKGVFGYDNVEQKRLFGGDPGSLWASWEGL